MLIRRIKTVEIINNT